MADDEKQQTPQARGSARSTGELRDARPARASDPDAEAALLSGEAWTQYCDALRDAGTHLLAVNADADAATRAEGIRYLLGLVRGGIGQALELAEPLRPRFFRNPDSSSRWGAENADNQYLWTRIDPTEVYRIRGLRRSAFDFLLEVKEGYMQLGDERNFATMTADEVACAPDSSFEIWLSAEPREGNWLRLDPDARYLAIRQYLCDWENEEPARFEIERVPARDAPDAPIPLLSPAHMAHLLQDAGEWTLQTARFFSEWTDGLRDGWRPDRIAPARKFAGGADDIFYGNDYYRLGADEALVIETEQPVARYWQFQLCDLWFRSADWSERQTSINQLQAHIDPDGRFRCVLAHADPGVPNWLDTGGASEGVLQYRWIGSSTNPQPTQRRVSLADVRSMLPEHTPRVSLEQRAELVRARARHRQRREPVS